MMSFPTPCLVCGGGLSAEADVMMNELIACDDCGTDYEVTGLAPLAVTEAPVEEEDWGE